MMTQLTQKLIVSIFVLCSVTNLAAKSEITDNGNYTTNDKEFYLTPEQLWFIRPGLDIEILNVEIPADMRLEVTYSIKDPAGLPLDHDGIYTPGPVDMRFTLANIPMFEEQKVTLAYEDIDAESNRRPTGTLTPLGDGVYKYKFETAIASDQDTTHTLVLGGRRDLREFELDRYVDNAIDDWVPTGMYDAVPRDVVTTTTCNRCHDPLQEHGRWLSPTACGQCHNPELVDDGVSYSLDQLIHRVHNEMEGYPTPINNCEACHTGGIPTENFPMVATPSAALVCDGSGLGETVLTWQYTDNVEIKVRTGSDQEGNLFTISGPTGSKATGKWVRDGTWFDIYDLNTKKLLQTVPVNATVLGCVSNAPGTFRGSAGAQHTNWTDHPSRAVCGSCHVDIDWETGEGHSEYNLVMVDDNTCHHCHVPYTDNEFDRSVKGAHLELYKSTQFPGVLINLLEVTNTNPGDHPTIKFSVTSKNSSIDPSTMNRLRFNISGPNDDYSFYEQETVGDSAAWVADNTWTYTFDTVLPVDAEGSFTVAAEGRNVVPIDFGDEVSDERDPAENPLLAFAVTDDNAMPRRMVVDDYNCESCHSNLKFHGSNRHDPQYCNTCHMPEATDRRDEQTIHLKYMIHSIHRGEDLAYGFSIGSHDYSEFVYPGDLRNCDACHVNNSQQVPVENTALSTITPQGFWSPMMPNSAACLSCHDDDDSAVHAYTNTAPFGESCGTCHGEGKVAAVDKVHAQ